MPLHPKPRRWLFALPLMVLACGRVSEIGSGNGSSGGSSGAADGGLGGGAGAGPVVAGGTGAYSGYGAQGGSSPIGGSGGVYGYGGMGGTSGAWGNPSPSDVLGDGWVVSELRLGDKDAAGNPSGTAWKSIGVDLDGLSSTKDSTDHCQPQPGANPGDVKADGNAGIDNSFGANVLPLLLGLDSDLSNEQQAYIDSGRSLVVVTGPLTPNMPSLVGSLTGARYAYSDSFDVVAPWFAYGASYVGGLARCSLSGSVVGGKLDLNGTGFWQLRLQLPMTELVMQIRHARVVAQVSPSAEALDGAMLAGLVVTEDFVEAVRQAIGRLDANLCDGSTFESIASQIRAASDIRTDSTNGDPAQACNAISVGFGVELEPVEARKGSGDPKDVQGCF